MSQNTLKVHDLNEDAEFDENGVEVFDEKALVEEEPSDSDLAEEDLLSQGATQRVLDATQLYLGEIGYSPLLTAEEEVYFARRALRGDVASRRRMNDVFQPRFCFSGVIMSNNKKTQASYVKPSRADIVRSVATSTAVETGQSSAKIEASLEATRKKFAHLRLAV